jgi:DNA-binding Lrp family transcriptional regulator
MHPRTGERSLSEQLDTLDEIDRTLIRLMRRNPTATSTELAAQAGIARNTAMSRVRRMESRGVITGYGPDVSPQSAGFGVQAFVTLSIAQGAHQPAVAALSAIAEILEIHTVTGRGDLFIKVVAPSNEVLHLVLQQVASIPQVGRTETQLALHTTLVRTVADLITMKDDEVVRQRTAVKGAANKTKR